MPAAAAGRVDDELGRGALDRVGRVQVGVADDALRPRPVGGLAHEQVPAGLLAAAAQVEQDVLAERGDAVGLGGPGDQGQDGLDVGRDEPLGLLHAGPDAGGGGHGPTLRAGACGTSPCDGPHVAASRRGQPASSSAAARPTTSR